MLTVEKIREAISASGVECDANKIDVDETFDSMGFDSLDRYNIIIEVQTLAGVEIPDQDIEKLISISAIESYFAKQ